MLVHCHRRGSSIPRDKSRFRSIRNHNLSRRSYLHNGLERGHRTFRKVLVQIVTARSVKITWAWLIVADALVDSYIHGNSKVVDQLMLNHHGCRPPGLN